MEEKLYQPYYTKSEPIVTYMVNKLSIKETDKIFEPCGGDGIFIDYILKSNPKAYIDVYELNKESIATLTKKFSSYSQINIKQSDTLLDNDLIFQSNFGGSYDKIIANPPYGAWQDYHKRKGLKKIFPNLYVKETYGLFLYRSIELLKENGILVFIIPDTYLNLHMHKELRKHLLTNTKIKEIALFPSSFFPNVNFGYANLSILTLQKSSNIKDNLSNEFYITTGFNDVSQLKYENLPNIKRNTYQQNEILNNPDHSFIISNDSYINHLIKNTRNTIGDIAFCVTGFYSGNDKRFLKVISPEIRNGKSYAIVKRDKINWDYRKNSEILNGIDDEKHFIPIVKGGNLKYLKPDNWFMDWSKKSVEHYKVDKKARFQNPKYYFRYGIGVPMISSTSITASLIENKLFDQSIVGIFPKEKNLTLYLLAFFNSAICNKLIRTINTSANNPANYIKKIPFVEPNKQELEQINTIVNQILKDLKNNNTYNNKFDMIINELIEKIYKNK
jgi:adenine-specific DNA-methyltransferase